MDEKKLELKVEDLKIERKELSVKIGMARKLEFEAEAEKMCNDNRWLSRLIEEFEVLLKFEKENGMTPEILKEYIMNAHTAGQRNGGVDPSESQALAYYNELKKIRQ